MIKLNGIPVNTTLFPDNTSQVWKVDKNFEEDGGVARIKWEYTHEGELMQLAQLVWLLRQEGWKYYHLHMPFLPYARQDKSATNQSTFALHVFADFINRMDFDMVTCYDAHNEKACDGLFNNFISTMPTDVLNKLLPHIDIVCFPDLSARSRYGSCFLGKDRIHFEKERDPNTGHITDMKLINEREVDLLGKRVLLVDDICDGGRTFIEAARVLWPLVDNYNAGSIWLYTTHGIYSKGLRPLHNANISRIYNHQGQAAYVGDNIVSGDFTL